MAACTLRLDHEGVVIGARTQLLYVFELSFDLEGKALSCPKQSSGAVSAVCYIIAIIIRTDRHGVKPSDLSIGISFLTGAMAQTAIAPTMHLLIRTTLSLPSPPRSSTRGCT